MLNFKTPVVVEPGVLGRFRVVMGPADALAVLSGRWPYKDGAKYRKAVVACQEAVAGQRKPHLARSSFVAAAREARVLITPEEFARYTVGNVAAREVASRDPSSIESIISPKALTFR